MSPPPTERSSSSVLQPQMVRFTTALELPRLQVRQRVVLLLLLLVASGSRRHKHR